MPTFLITSPDGSKFNVEGDNANGELAALKQHLGDGPSQSSPAPQGSSWGNDPIIAQSADGVQHQFPAGT